MQLLEEAIPDHISHHDEYLARLAENRLAGLVLGDSSLHPYYSGRSILNIPASVCRWLGASEFAGAPLDDQLTAALGSEFRRIILILMDGLAFQRLCRWMKDGTAPIWQTLADRGILAPITSISPSTTSAALTTLWSGRSAAEHGITGYEMWMKEYGIVANTILQMPITFKSDLGALERAGFRPEDYLASTTLGSHLDVNGVRSYAFQNHGIADSGLSRMLFKKVQTNAFSTAADLWINMRRLLDEKKHEKFFAWVYWGEVDYFSHFYGPDDERTAAEFGLFSHAMQSFFLNPISASARQGTLLILTADHGMITTPPDDHYDLRNHPGLLRRLHLNPTGEHRLAFLYVRPGQIEAVREYIERTWPNQFVVLDSHYAVDRGLFGPGEPHPNLLERVGDLIVIARQGAYLWWANKENRMLGRHGGLEADEMVVPFLAVRLEP